MPRNILPARSEHSQFPLPLNPRKTFIYPFPVVPADCEEPS